MNWDGANDCEGLRDVCVTHGLYLTPGKILLVAVLLGFFVWLLIESVRKGE